MKMELTLTMEQKTAEEISLRFLNLVSDRHLVNDVPEDFRKLALDCIEDALELQDFNLANGLFSATIALLKSKNGA